MTRRLVLAVVALLVASTLGACSGQRHKLPIFHYVDDGEQVQPLVSKSAGYSVSVPERSAHAPYSPSVVLFPTTDAPIRIEEVRPVASSPNLEVLGTRIAGPHRRYGQSLGTFGFPPDVPPGADTTYERSVGFEQHDEPRFRSHGIDVVIGVRRASGTRAWLDGIEVHFTMGERRYVGRFPVSFAVCAGLPCEAPVWGAPWDGAPE